MVEIANATSAGITRPIQFFHMPVPKGRTDDAYFAPLDSLHLHPETQLYLGLVHYDDAARIAAAVLAKLSSTSSANDGACQAVQRSSSSPTGPRMAVRSACAAPARTGTVTCAMLHGRRAGRRFTHWRFPSCLVWAWETQNSPALPRRGMPCRSACGGTLTGAARCLTLRVASGPFHPLKRK